MEKKRIFSSQKLKLKARGMLMHKFALCIRFEVMFDRTKRATGNDDERELCVKAHRKFFVPFHLNVWPAFLKANLR